MLEKLFEFQREDVEKLHPEKIKTRLIANEMGTGKTFEAGAIELLIRQEWEGSTLVVAPTSVLPAWASFFKDHTKLKTVQVNPKNRNASWQEFLSSDAEVFLVHWEALRLMPELKKLSWLHIIVDECHRMKNRKAQQTRALKDIKDVQFKTALSGTPVVNAPYEFWSVLNWLKPSAFKSYWKFYQQYTEFEVQHPQGYHKVKGPKDVDTLLEQIDPFYVRRLKADVLKDLPEKYYTTIEVELTPQQRKAYNTMKEHMISWIGKHEEQALVAPAVIAQLTRLMQFSVAYGEFSDENNPEKLILTDPSSKLDALLDILEDNPDEQFVVFSRFKGFVDLASNTFERKGISHVKLTGDTPQEERGKIVEDFQKGNVRIFIGTIAAGGVGITLHSASTIIFVDRDWSPALNAQAEDRLHRIGQKNAVQVIDIIAKDTIDRGRHQKLELKLNWIKNLLGDK
jgi:SNF2 family DNA or RNA helicase